MTTRSAETNRRLPVRKNEELAKLAASGPIDGLTPVSRTARRSRTALDSPAILRAILPSWMKTTLRGNTAAAFLPARTAILVFLLLFARSLLFAGGTEPRDIAPLYTKYKDGRYQEVYLACRQLLEKDADNPELNLLAGRVLVETGKSREAMPLLEKALAGNGDAGWVSAWALCYRGQARFYTDDYEGARTDLNECLSMQAGESVTRTAQRFLLLIAQTPYFQTWLTKETAHFRFHIQPPLSAEALESYAAEHERTYARISGALGEPKLPKKIDVVAWANRLEPMERFQVSVNQADPAKAIVYCARSQGPCMELAYVVAFYAAEGERGETTGFISTGLAVYLEEKDRPDAELLKDYLHRKQIDKISTADVWNRWKKYPEAYSHPLAGAFVRELIERFGMEKFKKVLASQTYDDARLVYGYALDEMIGAFDARFSSASDSTVKQTGP